MDALFSLRNKTHSTLTNKNEDLRKHNVIMNELVRQIQLNALSFVTLRDYPLCSLYNALSVKCEL